MPALMGYMLAIVVTLGGYFAGLHWLISPPDPWQQSSARTQTTGAAPAVRKRPPAVKPAELAASAETAAPPEAETSMAAAAAAPAPAPTRISERSVSAEPAIAPPPPQPATPPRPATLPRAEEKPAMRSEAARPEPRRETKIKPVQRKLAERSPGRKLQLMVLRTYQRSDGTRFSRLISVSEARDVVAFQPDW